MPGGTTRTSRARQNRPFSLVLREHPLQKQIADVLRIEIALQGRLSPQGVVWWAVDPSNYADVAPGARIARGQCAGVPDLFFLWAGRAFFIELKAADGEVRGKQRNIIAAILGAGGRAGVACTVEQVLTCLDEWSVPRAGRVRRAA